MFWSACIHCCLSVRSAWTCVAYLAHCSQEYDAGGGAQPWRKLAKTEDAESSEPNPWRFKAGSQLKARKRVVGTHVLAGWKVCLPVSVALIWRCGLLEGPLAWKTGGSNSPFAWDALTRMTIPAHQIPSFVQLLPQPPVPCIRHLRTLIF